MEKIKKMLQEITNGLAGVLVGAVQAIFGTLFYIVNPLNWLKIAGFLAVFGYSFYFVEKNIGWNEYTHPIKTIVVTSGKIMYNLSLPILNSTILFLQKKEATTMQQQNTTIDHQTKQPTQPIVIQPKIVQKHAQKPFFVTMSDQLKGLTTTIIYGCVLALLTTFFHKSYNYFYHA